MGGGGGEGRTIEKGIMGGRENIFGGEGGGGDNSDGEMNSL